MVIECSYTSKAMSTSFTHEGKQPLPFFITCAYVYLDVISLYTVHCRNIIAQLIF